MPLNIIKLTPQEKQTIQVIVINTDKRLGLLNENFIMNELTKR